MRSILSSGASSCHHSLTENVVAPLLRDYGQVEFVCMSVAIVCGTVCCDNNNSVRDEPGESVDLFRKQHLPTFLGQTSLLEGPQVRCEHVSKGINAATFTASAFTRGALLYLSRVLAPVWHRPLLTCDKQTPSMSQLWSEEVLGAILGPITAFASFLDEFYPHATSAKPLSEKDKASLLTKYAQFVSQDATSSTSQIGETLLGAGHNNTFYSAHNVAKELETSQLACLYRLIDRVKQALQLLLLIAKRLNYLETQSKRLLKLGKKISSQAEEAAMVSPRSLELSIKRDRVLHQASRVKRQAVALSLWRYLVPPVSDGSSSGSTLHAICTDPVHSVALRRNYAHSCVRLV